MRNFLFKNRGQLLLIIIIIDIFFPAFLAKDQFEIGNLYWLSQICTGTLIVIAAIYLYIKLGEYEYLLNKQAFLGAYSPYVYIYYDAKNKLLEVSENAVKLLHLPVKEKYNLEEVKKLFNQDDWYEINQCVTHGQDYKLLDKSGVISIQNHNYTGLFLRYNAHYISSLLYNVEGIMFWFSDHTESIRNEMDIIALLKRYRLIGFELDLLFNSLPFPLWRREVNGEIVFYNQAFEELQKQFGQEVNSTNEFRKILSKLANEVESANLVAKSRKHFIFHNTHYIYELIEQPVGHGNIGYALDIKQQDKIEKDYKALQVILENVLELSLNAIAIIDGSRRISQFNQAYVNIFELDANWLTTKPGYSQLLDKLRELRKLPEVSDYNDYKEMQLHLLADLTAPQIESIYLPNGQTLRLSIIPSRAGSIILMYENITETLGNERTYNELQALYNATIQSLSEPLITFNGDGRVKAYNQAFIKLSGISGNLLAALPHFHKMLADMKNIEDKSRELLRKGIIGCLESRLEQSNSVVIGEKECVCTIHSMPDCGALITFIYH